RNAFEQASARAAVPGPYCRTGRVGRIGLFANADGRTPPSGPLKSSGERCIMESKREQAIVGLFVLVAGAVLVATVFALTGAFAGAAATYRAYVPFAGGLEPGSTVRYAGGPKVGRVEKLQLDPKDSSRIEITFSVRSG